MEKVRIGIAENPVYICKGISYKALETRYSKGDNGKWWPVADVSYIISLLKSKPKWISLKMPTGNKTNVLAFTSSSGSNNKMLSVIILEPIIPNQYYIDNIQNAIVPYPEQVVCSHDMPLVQYDLSYLKDFDLDILHSILNGNKKIFDLGYNVEIIDISNIPHETSLSQIPIYPKIPNQSSIHYIV